MYFDPRWSKFISKMMIVCTLCYTKVWMYSWGMYALCITPTLKEALLDHTSCTHSPSYGEKNLRQSIMLMQHDIKHNCECGSLTWLVHIYFTGSCHAPTETSYQQWRKAGLIRPISGLPSIDQSSFVCTLTNSSSENNARGWNVTR